MGKCGFIWSLDVFNPCVLFVGTAVIEQIFKQEMKACIRPSLVQIFLMTWEKTFDKVTDNDGECQKFTIPLGRVS